LEAFQRRITCIGQEVLTAVGEYMDGQTHFLCVTASSLAKYKHVRARTSAAFVASIFEAAQSLRSSFFSLTEFFVYNNTQIEHCKENTTNEMKSIEATCVYSYSMICKHSTF
jgi:dephospho-CoA kinase